MGDGLEKLPDDIEALHAALLATRAELAIVRAQQSDDQALIAHLKLQIERLNRDRHGPRSERTARLLDQLELTLEELETSATEDELTAEMAAAKTANGTTTVASFSRKRPSRKPFPDHLPRERVVVPRPVACACCGGTRLSKLGEDITETLEVVPKSWKVIQHVREKFGCRDCEKIGQAPAPFHVIARGWAGPSLLAMVLFEKFGQHQPLNRQAERYAREGVPVSLSTLADQVGGCTLALMPLFNLLEAHVLAAERLHGDDTTVPVLAKGKTSTGRIWGYVRDDKPFGGQARQGLCFTTHAIALASIRRRIWRATAGSSRPTPMAAMAGSTRPAAMRVQSWRPPAGSMPDGRSSCWPTWPKNARRKAQGKKPAVISPLALEAVRRIDALFEIERGVNGETQERRRAVRQELSAPLIADLEGWIREQRAKPSRGNDVAKAMDYMLKRWSAFTRFLDDGRIYLSNNAAERALRGIALGRKSWLFCGSDRGGDRAALMYSLIVTAKMNDIDPQAWLADVLDRIAEHPAHRLDELLPLNWRDTIRRVDRAA